MSYSGHLFGEFYPSVKIQSMYSTAPADWAIFLKWQRINSSYKTRKIILISVLISLPVTPIQMREVYEEFGSGFWFLKQNLYIYIYIISPDDGDWHRNVQRRLYIIINSPIWIMFFCYLHIYIYIYIYTYIYETKNQESIIFNQIVRFSDFKDLGSSKWQYRLELPTLCYHPGWRLMRLRYRTCFHTLYDEKRKNIYIWDKESGKYYF